MRPTSPDAERPPEGPLPPEDDGLSLGAGLSSLRKHWPLALATAVFVVLGAVFYTLGQKKIYEASATLQFDPNPPRPLGKEVQAVVDMGAGDYWNNREYYETQYKVIQSLRVSMAAVRELGLEHDAAFLENAPPGVPARARTVSVEEAAQILRARLQVRPVKESRLAVATYRDADPERAQRILTTLVDTYVAQNLEDAVASASAAVDWLRGQLDKLKNDLESNEMALHDFKKSHNILSVSFDDQTNMLREELRQLNEALTQVRARREEIAARHTELARVTADERVKLSAHELLSSPLLGALRQRFEDVTRERDGLRGRGLGENHPEFKEADLKVLAAREAVLAEVRNIQGSVERDLAVVKRQEAGLLGLVERAKAQALELNLLDIEFSRLRRSKESTEKLHALLLERTTETDLQRRLRVNNIHVVEYPLLPSVHVYPRFSIFFALGALLGVVLGFVVALLRVALDRTIKTPDDVERYLRQTFLGLLPMADQVSVRAEPYRRRGRRPKPDKEIPPELVVHHFPMSSFAESARVVRTNLMFMSPDKPHRVLLVTSAGPEEGKTTVACGIALAMAQAGKRVCLVDCDLRRSRLHHVFRRPSDQGLTTFLVEDRIPSEEDLATDIPRLGVLCAGPHPPNPAEIVHSERFRALLEALAERYDRVVIDSPPLVAVTDAAIISTVVDATVLVVRAFRSRRELARHAVRTLRDLDSNVLGVILNAVDFARREYKYDYYYRSYAKDYYYRREGEDAEDRGSGEIEPRSDSQPQAP